MHAMEEEKKLYPLRFEPVEVEQPWGKTAYALADLGMIDSEVSSGWLIGDSLSDIMETYIDRVVGDDVYYYYGRQFPLSVTQLQVQGRTPLWVCPPDGIAAQRYDALGKAKLWYVTQAGPRATLYLGLDKTLSATEFYTRCEDGSLPECLHAVVPKAGDCFFIAPGKLHAAEDVEIVEVAEASLLDIPVFRWGEAAGEDELGLADALDFVDLKAFAPKAIAEDDLCDAEALSVRRIRLSGELRTRPEEDGCFRIYTCVKGAASLQAEGLEPLPLRQGQSLLVAAETAEVTLTPSGGPAILLESAVRCVVSPDSYINPEADPFPEGEDGSPEGNAGWADELLNN